jgi:hypothetical protein
MKFDLRLLLYGLGHRWWISTPVISVMYEIRDVKKKN